MEHVRLPDIQMTFTEDGAVFLRSGSSGIGAKAPPFVTAILAMCSSPMSRETIGERLGPAAAQAYDQLVELGLLTTVESAGETPVIFGNYAGIEVHRRMLMDDVRTELYRKGLCSVIQPGDVVIDAGSGTGILATMAAIAGARKVYAIEKTDMARVIHAVAQASGVGDVVEVIQGDISKVQVPEKARVIVHELFGAWALAEGFMPNLSRCAENNLTEDGILVPGCITLWLAPLREAPPILLHPFRRRSHGLDLTPLLPEARSRASLLFANENHVGTPARVADLQLPCRGVFSAEIELEGPCEALVGWFDLQLAPDVSLPTGPLDPKTHWRQSVIPLSLPPGRHRIRVHGGPDPGDFSSLMVTFDGDEVRQDVCFR